MDHTGAPGELWWYATTYAYDLLNHMAHRSLDWKTPIETAFGHTPDISALIQYSFYEPVLYLEPECSFPNAKDQIGRFFGPYPQCR